MTDPTTLLEYGAAGVVGALALFGIGNTTWRGKKKDDSEVAQQLIDNLKLSLDQEKTKTANLTTELTGTNTKLSHTQGELATAKEILQGRDPLQAQVFKDAPAAFAYAKENHEMSKQNSQAITKLTETMQGFLEAIKPLMDGHSAE